MKNFTKILITVLCVMSVISLGMIGKATLQSVDHSHIKLNIAHGQAKDSLVDVSIRKMANIVNQNKTGNMEVSVYSSGVLGSEKEMIELVQAGVLDMAKVGAPALEQFDNYYSVFALPYVFTGTEHYYRAMDHSAAIKEIFTRDQDQGFIAIGWYASGARNLYKKEPGPAESPADLKGKKFRTMLSSTAMNMIECMGGAPVPMGASETYTSLQQNIIDGAENTEMALTVDKHGEQVKSYTYTEHQYTPDIVIISTVAWNRMTDEQKDELVDALKVSNETYKEEYAKVIGQATKEAEEMGVKFYRIDKKPFIQAVQSMHEAFKAKGTDYARYYDDIQQYKD